MALRLLNAVTATTSAPTLVTDGIALQGEQTGYAGYWQRQWDAGIIDLHGAGTGALTFQGIVFLYSPLTGAWAPAGIASTIANRGMLNDGTTITGTTTLDHTQQIDGLSAYTRIALQASTLTGTNMTVSAYLMQRFV